MKKVFFLLTAVLVFFSCSGGKISSKSTDDKNKKTEVIEDVKESGTDRITQLENAILSNKDEKKKEQNKVSADNYGNRRFLMTSRKDPVLPEDIIIGALWDPDGSNSSESPEQTVYDFLNKLINIKKEPDEKFSETFFEKENRYFLERTFFEWSDNDMLPETFRISTAKSSSSTSAKVNFRGFKERGVSTGEFFLSKSSGKWKISGFSGDFSELEDLYLRAEEQFEPEIYFFY